jgi:signal transduction histidine kinase
MAPVFGQHLWLKNMNRMYRPDGIAFPPRMLLLLRSLIPYCLLLAGPLHAAVLDVPEAAERLPLGAALDYFLDATAALPPEAAMRDGRYRPADGASLSLGYRSEVLWARLVLRNPGAAPLERWLQLKPERLERASLFLPEPGGGWRRLDNGIEVPVARRPIPVRGIVFPLRLEAGQTLVLYLRLQTRTALSLLPILWQPQAFRAATQRDELLAMLSIGALLGLAAHALLLFLLHRDRATLYLGLEMISVGLFETCFHGYGYTYLMPNRPDWGWWLTPFFTMLSLAFFNRFFRTFLPLASHGLRHAGLWLDGLLLVDLVMIARHLLGAPHALPGPILPLAAFITIASNLVVTLALSWRGYRPARPLAMGLGLSLSLWFPRIGEMLGWLSFSPMNIQMLITGVMLISNLYFFAGIGRRVELLQWDKEAAQALALQAQRTAAERLEAEVAERTAELRAAKERAEQADRAKGEFMARVSHELRTPLHTVLGYAHLLRRDAAGLSGERLASLEEGGTYLARLIDDLLDYTRGERGGLALHPEAVFLYRLLERLREHGAALTDPRRHRFETRFDADLPASIRVDARRLEQVVLILLSNAVRYTRNGRIGLTVLSLGTRGDRARLRFEVEDTGAGIAADDLARIFEPFERAGSGHAEGLGLGLAIGRQIVRALGGELRVESRLGAGSRFWFEAEVDLAAEEDVPVRFPDLDLCGYAGRRRTILVVEDHAANRRLLEQLLGELGFTVHGAGRVDEGLRLAATVAFDLALLDQRLPDGTAWDILRALRGGGATMPVALLSAQPPRPPDDWGDWAGFDAALLKPLGGAEVLECVGGLLGLVWLRAEPKADGEPAGHAAAVREPPSAEACGELAEWARLGAVYEIEEWIAGVRRNHPESGEFCREVENRLAALDFGGIAAMEGMEAGRERAAGHRH